MTEQIGRVKLDLTHYPGEDLYCDGDVEDELLAIARDMAEVEYQRVIEERASWPVLYHLSPLRENIVEWLPIGKDARVLEVGSGCGAITGTLSKKAGEVTCVELSRKRSLINAYRHSECDNVTIHVGNFKDIEPELPQNYDYIFLIGVFEYAQSYMGTENPFEDFLSIIMKHVKKRTGRVVIAIENKYGLKYFAGCKEDHLGTWFSGVGNYPEGGGVRTFSREGLEKIFAACGLKKYHFYYPYPDYKFMTALYSDACLPGRGELSNNLRNYDRERMLLFDEKHAFDGIVGDGLFSVFANSYEVVIGDGFDVKYVKYSNDRVPEYKIRTEICMDGEGAAEVKKHPLCEEAEEHIRGMADAYSKLCERYRGGELSVNRCELHEEEGRIWNTFEFLNGKLLSELLDECLERDDTEGFRALFRQYYDRISYNSGVPVADYDLIFSNIIVRDGEWSLIDYEWTFGREIEPREIAFRALYCYLLEDEKRNKLNLDLILQDLEINEEEAQGYRQREKEFQGFVTGKRMSMMRLWEVMGKKLYYPEQCIFRVETEDCVKKTQVYEDRGKGFSEEESYFMPVSCWDWEKSELELTLEVDADVQALRIDPMSRACVVSIRELNFNEAPVPLQNKDIFSVNGTVLRSGKSFVFATRDPNMSVRLAGLARRGKDELYVRMTVTELFDEVAKDMEESAQGWLERWKNRHKG